MVQDSRCIVSCGPQAQAWGLFGFHCVPFGAEAFWRALSLPASASEDPALLWQLHNTEALLNASLSSITHLGASPSDSFPATPQCVPLTPPAPGVPSVSDPCQETATVSWRSAAALESLPRLPAVTMEHVAHENAWMASALGGLPGLEHVAAVAAGAPAAAAEISTVRMNPSEQAEMDAIATILGLQWSVISAAVANGTTGFALLYRDLSPSSRGPQPLHWAAQLGSAAHQLPFEALQSGPHTTLPGSLGAASQAVRLPLLAGAPLQLIVVASGSAAWSQHTMSARAVILSTAACSGIQLLVQAAAQVREGATARTEYPLHVPGHSWQGAANSGERQLQENPGDQLLFGASFPVLRQPQVPTPSEPLVVSPAYTPDGVQATLVLPSPLELHEVVEVACSVARNGLEQSALPPSVSVSPATWRVVGGAVAGTGAPSGARGNVTHRITLTPLWLTASMQGAIPSLWGGVHELVCVVTSSLHPTAPPSASRRYPEQTRLTMPVFHAPAIVPLFGDAALQASTGGWMSAWLQQTPSEATARSARQPGASVQFGAAGTLSTDGMDASILQALLAVSSASSPANAAVSASASVSEALAATTAVIGTGAPSFTLTVTGSQQVLLSAAGSPGIAAWPGHVSLAAGQSPPAGPTQPFAFAPGLRVWVGSAEAEVDAVSCDGLLARVSLPSFEALCGASTTGELSGANSALPCEGGAYKELTVANPPMVPATFLSTLQAMHDPNEVGQASTNCSWVHRADPVFAEGLAAWSPANSSHGAIQLEAADVLGGVLGGAIGCPSACPGRNSPGVSAAGSSEYGVYVTSQCTGFPEPGPQCFAEALRRVCAFGQGGACSACGEGAVCPGGFRRWPLAGYWAPSEAAPAGVTRCAVPAQERCLGWDATAGAAMCGVGYDPAAPACGGCDEGFYPETGGQCAACPSGPGHENMLLAIGLFLAACTALFLLVAAAIRALAWFKGGTVGGGLYRASEFVMWTITTLQVFVQVGRDASPGLPAFLQSFYGRLRLLQLDSASLLHPACYVLGAFTMEIVQLGGALLLVALSAGLSAWRKTEAARGTKPANASVSSCVFWLWLLAEAKPWMRRACLVLLTLLYPLVANTAFTLVHCVSSAAPGGQGGGASELRLASSTFYVCYGEEHFAAGVLAWACIVFVVGGFPLASFLWLRRRIAARMLRSPAAAKYKALVVSLKRQQALVRQRRCTAVCGWLTAACGGCGGGPAVPSETPTLRKQLSQDVTNPLAALEAPSARTAAIHHPAPAVQLDSDEEEWLAQQAVAEVSNQTPRGIDALDVLRTQRSTSRVRALAESNAANGLDAMASAPAPVAAGTAGAKSVGDQATSAAHNPLAARTQRQSVLMRVDQKLQSQQVARPHASGRAPRRSIAASAARRAADGSRWCDLVLAPAVRHTLCTVPQRYLSSARRNCLKRAGCRCRAVDSASQAAQRTAARLDTLLDCTQELQDDVSLIHFTAIDYRPSRAYFRHFDLLLLATMAAVFVFLSAQNTVADASGSLVIILVCLLCLAVALYAQQPFLRGHEWKGPVRIGALLVTALASILNFVAACAFDLEGCSATSAAVQALSVMVALCAAMLFLVLIVSFWLVLWRGAAAEAAKGKQPKTQGYAKDITYATGGNPLVKGAARRQLPSLQAALTSARQVESKASPSGGSRKKGLAAFQLTMQPSQRRLGNRAADRSSGSGAVQATGESTSPLSVPSEANSTPSVFAAATLGHFRGNVDAAKRGRTTKL